MMRALALVGSTRTAIAGFAVLGVALLIARYDAAAPSWLVVAPLCLIALNLAVAIAVHPRLRRGGLGLFHVALLALLLAVAIGRLTHFDGRIEITEGGELDPAAVETDSRGALHGFDLRRGAFVQGRFSVDYTPGVRRARTFSEVGVLDARGVRVAHVVGDDTPLVLHGYRFYTTHNKGFAPIVTWLPDGGTAQTGSLHMPSYPLFEWGQENRFTPPGGPEIRAFLRVDRPLDESAAWTLDPRTTPTTLVVHAEGRRSELAPGASVRLAAGTLRFDRTTGWMGYRIFFDPTLPWLFALSIIAVAGLALHLWGRSVSSAVSRAPATTQSGSAA